MAQAHKKLSSAENSTKAKTEIGQKVIEIYKKRLEDNLKDVPIPIPTLLNGVSDTDSTPTTTTKVSPDKFTSLHLKYTNKEVALIKKIIKMMTDYCPSAQAKLIDELTGKVIEILGK